MRLINLAFYTNVFGQNADPFSIGTNMTLGEQMNLAIYSKNNTFSKNDKNSTLSNQNSSLSAKSEPSPSSTNSSSNGFKLEYKVSFVFFTNLILLINFY